MKNYILWQYHKKEDGTVIQTPVEINSEDKKSCPKCNTYFLIEEKNIMRCAGCFYITCYISNDNNKCEKIDKIKNCFHVPVELVKENKNWFEVKYELNSAKEINILKDKINNILNNYK